MPLFNRAAGANRKAEPPFRALIRTAGEISEVIAAQGAGWRVAPLVTARRPAVKLRRNMLCPHWSFTISGRGAAL
jgi:hypothetical protein